MNTVDIFEYLQNKRKFENLSGLRTNILAKINNIVSIVREKTEGAGERFLKLMMMLSIIKLAIAMTTLIVMTVLLFTHLHVFDPITLQFSKWVSSPIISFIVLIIVVKFAGISIGLTLTVMTVKKITFKSIRLKLKEYCKPKLRVFLRKKVQLQTS
jgi:hypothetical protein